MLGRGPLRHPFIFLESFLPEGAGSPFTPGDLWEVASAYLRLLEGMVGEERHRLVQLRKVTLWMSGGLPGAAGFREGLFAAASTAEVLGMAGEFFHGLAAGAEREAPGRAFMAGGHG